MKSFLCLLCSVLCFLCSVPDLLGISRLVIVRLISGVPLKSQFGIFTTDRRLVIRTWDAWLERVTSRPAKDVCGKELIEVFPELENGG